MTKLAKSSVLAVTLIAFLTSWLWAVDLYLDVSKGKYRKIVIAIPDFEGHAASGAEAAKIITNDLKFSGYFKTVDGIPF